MSEYGIGKEAEDLKALLDSYSNSGDYAQKDMKKKYPHINFDKLIAEARGETYKAPTSNGSSSGNIWTTVLEWAAWATFFAAVGGGFSNASLVRDFTDNTMFAFITFVVISAIGFLSLAYAMIFIQMAKDVSRTAKDTAEIKELLKK